MVSEGRELQWLVGMFSVRKYSLVVGHPEQGSVPVSGQMEILATPSGIVISVAGDKRVDIILFQIVEAPVNPEAILLIGELSLLPTHTATSKFWL